MAPHQERVVTERNELSEKTEKLGAFIDGEIFQSLLANEQTRLVRQFGYMKLYLEVLDQRIAAF